MPKNARTLADYRTELSSRTGEERSQAIQRHREYLSGKGKEGAVGPERQFTLQSDALMKLGGDLSKGGRKNSQSYDDILRTLNAINNMMDVMISVEATSYATESILNTYAMLLQQCDAYLDSHRSHRFTEIGKQRVAAVRELRGRVEDEAQLVQDALEEVDSFGTGITLRQLMAGMRPLKEAEVSAQDFSVPHAVEYGPQQAPEIYDPVRTLERARESIRENEDIAENDRAVLDVLLEQISRARLERQEALEADMVDRVLTLCLEMKPADAFQHLYMACVMYKAERKLQVGTDNEGVSIKIDIDDEAQYEGDDAFQLSYPEYRHLSPEVMRYLAQNTSFNQGEAADQLYGAKEGMVTKKVRKDNGEIEEQQVPGVIMNQWGMAHGYIQTANSFDINEYLRKLHDRSGYQDHKVHQSFNTLSTIGLLDQASSSGALPEKTRVHRMLNMPYLKYVFGIDTPDNRTVTSGLARQVNQQAGKIVTDSNFMCTGFVVDTQFAESPIMLTLLCDEGTPVFTTSNLAEGEIIFGRNTSYMILGAVVHGKGSELRVPMSHLRPDNQYGEGLEKVGNYRGLEIFAKVLNTAEQVPNRAQSKEAFEAFQAKQSSYVGLYGDHGDYVHRDAYLEMARADQASLTPQEARAMDEYTNDSAAINRRLRSGEVQHDVTDAQNSFMKQAFAKHPIPVNLDVFRGVSDGFLTYLLSSDPSFTPEIRSSALNGDGTLNHRWLAEGDHYKIFEGITFRDAAFVSTSTNKYFARRWANMVRHQEEAAKYKGKTDAASRAAYQSHTGGNEFKDISGAHVLNMHLPAGTRAMFVDTMFTRTNRPRGQDEVTLDAGYTYTITSVTRVGEGMYEMEVTCVG